MGETKKQLCTIRIMFAVDSDEEAIDYKKKIESALADKGDSQMQFTLMPAPAQKPQP